MEDKKSRTISWVLAKVNFGITAMILIFTLGWALFSLIMPRMEAAKREFWLLVCLYSFLGIPILISIVVGIFISIVDINHKKEKAKKAFLINLILALIWVSLVCWFFISAFKNYSTY